MNILENLIKSQAKSNYAFAKLVGVTPQKLRVQVKSKSVLFFAFTYAKQLGVKQITGTDNNNVKITITWRE